MATDNIMVLRTIIDKTIKGVTWDKQDHSVTLVFDDSSTLTLTADTTYLQGGRHDLAQLCFTITPAVSTKGII